MTSFGDLTKQVHLINDLILSDMVCAAEDGSKEESFRTHLMATKYWFYRISWPNKKRYLLALLHDVRSVWTLSLLLKSTWNCRLKDAVLSVCQPTPWSSYDQVPMDHNRTALPVSVLAQVMKNDRLWFLSLTPESQALVLLELLTIGGGPTMWEVQRRAQILYERNKDKLLENLQECTVLSDMAHSVSGNKSSGALAGKHSKTKVAAKTSEPVALSPAQKELDAKMAIWNSTLKSMRDNLKLEEFEMSFNDGSKKKIWKVNRPKPEVVETVDFLQLLPASLGMRILSYLPRAQLNDYARVNKYWAFLVDEFRAELAARVKINADFQKLKELLIRHDTDVEIFHDASHSHGFTSSGILSAGHSMKGMKNVIPSEKSGGAYSLRNFLIGNLNKPSNIIAHKPIRNMAELSKRLDRRGAADEHIWDWCSTIEKIAKKNKRCYEKAHEGVLALENVHFPCPHMKKSIEVPLSPPLYKDPSVRTEAKPRRNISNATLLHYKKTPNRKRYSLWTRDLSNLYPVVKIPSYQSPI